MSDDKVISISAPMKQTREAMIVTLEKALEAAKAGRLDGLALGYVGVAEDGEHILYHQTVWSHVVSPLEIIGLCYQMGRVVSDEVSNFSN